ncbi:MAG: M20/M25/M40 family metallo-hydrolase [Proteobacteria bacterium]|nr:M20/M25/M40 family metallo-hydrolase [Pseudomonadota bacterium]
MAKSPAKTSPALQSALKHTQALLAIPAASNRIEAVADYVVAHAKKLGLKAERQHDDTLRITIMGKDAKRVVGYGAHLDRIGLMVHELFDDGTIQISAIGGLYPGHVMDGVTASIQTKKGLVEGLIFHTDTPIHKVGREGFEKRAHKWKNIRLRPDACIGASKKNGKEKLKDLGIQIGQLVWLDPLLAINTKHQTLRSRWLDNTLGCAVLLALMDTWSATKAKPRFTIDLIFSAAEEAGMGGTSVIRPEMTDFVAVDTSVGEDVEDINNCSIKQKAGAFPYSQSLTEELEAAAEKAKVGFERRVFEGGGTDAEQARSAGFKGRIACIVTPIYNLHSVESATFTALQGVIQTLHTHAIG